MPPLVSLAPCMSFHSGKCHTKLSLFLLYLSPPLAWGLFEELAQRRQGRRGNTGRCETHLGQSAYGLVINWT